ncbi:Gfo/Idh/MocA family oxidoreductase [Kineococcus esterisolvens]|uniref:Gfo/Idh/MocA family oxidoreductase n=1 Tax=unclassified Kineococcus TaxID=2621656 RepID=UPI003D7E0428
MSVVAPTGTAPTGIGLLGAGRIGSSHARLIATRVPNARLVAVADVRPGAAAALAEPLGAVGYTDVDELLANPEVEAVVITAITEAHADLVETAARAGKGVFCEKPAGLSLDEIDRGIAATTEAGVAFQVGFNRRFAAEFAAARAAIDAGRIGTPQLLRSLTRDPGLVNPAGVPPWTIFLLTLIHDFDTLLFLNPGAEPTSVYAVADALVAPDFKDAGLLDTAVVTIRFDNGAIATAEANFSATYGYDVRGEVFGSGGRLDIGGQPRQQLSISDASGRHFDTPRGDTELFPDAYAGELSEFAAAVRENRVPAVTGHDAKRALSIALSCIASYRSGAPVDPAVVAKTIDGRTK